MSISAVSVAIRGRSPSEAARTIADAVRRLPRPSGGVVFASGVLAERLDQLAEALAASALGLPMILASGAGVLTERGEIEGESAAAALLWSGGNARTFCARGNGADELGERLAKAVAAGNDARRGTLVVFMRPDGVAPHALEPLQQLGGISTIFGAGSVGSPGVLALNADGSVQRGGAAAMLLHGLPVPSVRTSPACRLLMPLRRITDSAGSMVLELEGEPALDVLSTVAEGLADQPLIFAVLAEGDAPRAGRAEVVVRAVQGVDPIRRGLMVSDEVRPGLRMAFAVRDPGAAKLDLEAVLRELSQQLAGAAPCFGLYLTCAGRGASLYGSYSVDVRMLRARFGDIPLAGMHSSFELAPHEGKPTVQLYTGVLALFSQAS